MSLALKVKNSKAEISLENGGSLTSLVLNGKQIIRPDDNPLKSFASSILFPFANRINKGEYSYNSEDFQLDVNMPPNAIHGLVFDKIFSLDVHENNLSSAKAEMIYIENIRDKGFPFLYNIKLKYTLEATSLKLKVSVENTDLKTFPFSLGWHPYFWVNSVDSCLLSINSSEKFQVDEHMIPIGSKSINWNGFRSLNNLKLDDGFKLNDNQFKLKTPHYQILGTMTSDENYLQIYTPEHRKSIAIEPMTAAADGLNNKIGLKELKPNQIFEVEWHIELL